MSLRTYGDKPMSFQLEENGEYFYVGSEVSRPTPYLQTNKRTHQSILIHCFYKNPYPFL